MIPHPSRWLRITWAACLSLIWFGASAGPWAGPVRGDQPYEPEAPASESPGRPAPGEQRTQIDWREDYAAALDEAKLAGRPLWIQFTGPWCPNCTRMERDTFPAPAIIQYAHETFVPLKLRSDIQPQLAESFNLTGIPASIVVSPNLEVLAFQQGYLGPAELDAFLIAGAARGGIVSAKPPKNCRETASRTEKRPGESQTKLEPNRLPLAQLREGDSPGRPDEPTAKETVEPKLSLLGYCPVSLVRERKLVRGQAAFAVEQEGRVYRFAKLELADEFRISPDRFIPRKDGNCPVTEMESGKKLPGSPKWGVIYQDHLFLCASAEARLQFVKSPDRYAAPDGDVRVNDRPFGEPNTGPESTE
jgi:thiol-disulfide isomerase/thioredoxin